MKIKKINKYEHRSMKTTKQGTYRPAPRNFPPIYSPHGLQPSSEPPRWSGKTRLRGFQHLFQASYQLLSYTIL
jgi:hypothetical protein